MNNCPSRKSLNLICTCSTQASWCGAKAALGGKFCRSRGSCSGQDETPRAMAGSIPCVWIVFIFLCPQIQIWEGPNRRPRGCWVPQGRSSTWEASVSPARDNSIVTLGSPGPPTGYCSLCAARPFLPISAWLSKEVLGTVLNEFRKFLELIQANILFSCCFSSACRVLPRPTRRVPGLSSAPSAFPCCCSRLTLAGSAPGFARG